ncbi:MAG: hypothetical protein V3U54_07655 [Thermodesulfobacteriota bacterium]
MKSSVDWEKEKVLSEDIIWWSKLDNRFLIQVRRLRENEATMCIFDHDNDDEMMSCEQVSLAYGAIYGPDVADIATWQERAVEIVDHFPKKKTKEDK